MPPARQICKRSALATLLMVFVLTPTQAQQPPSYGSIHPVVIEKDAVGRLTRDSEARLAEAIAEIREHGMLRAWVVANISFEPPLPTDPAFERKMRVVRAIQKKIVTNLGEAMEDILPGEVYPSVGPYVAVTIDEAGARALVGDRLVQSFCVLVPTY